MKKPSVNWQLCIDSVLFITTALAAVSSLMLVVVETQLYLLVSSTGVAGLKSLALELLKSVAQALGSSVIAVLLARRIWRRTHPTRTQEVMPNESTETGRVWPPAPKT